MIDIIDYVTYNIYDLSYVSYWLWVLDFHFLPICGTMS